MSAEVQFRDVEKRFGEQAAVTGLTLTIERGEFFTLLGPSGSGKTTTLRMLAGLEIATSGDILIDGRSVTRVVPEKRNIGLVFQHYALFPHLSVFENIAFPLKMRRLPKAEIARRVSAVLDMTRLEAFRDRYPNQLSGGQQQRVALCRSFVYDPSILLMDEPLGALDRNLRDHMRIELKSLQQRIGATVLYVTHDQDEALSMSDRVGVMHNGVLQQVATPDELYERPMNSFVGTFLGDSVCMPATRIGSNGGGSVLRVDGIDTDVLVDAGGDVCPSDTGVMLVRPEQLSLAAEEPTSRDVNRVKGVVNTIVYLGSKLQVLVDTGEGAKLGVELPSAGVRPEPGGTYWLTWHAGHTRFLQYVP